MPPITCIGGPLCGKLYDNITELVTHADLTAAQESFWMQDQTDPDLHHRYVLDKDNQCWRHDRQVSIEKWVNKMMEED